MNIYFPTTKASRNLLTRVVTGYLVGKWATVLVLLWLSSCVLNAQPTAKRFSAFKATSLSSATDALTIQQPSTGGRRVIVRSTWVACTVDCTITVAMNGTAATTTTGTLVALTPASGTPVTKMFTASNAGSGTTVASFLVTGGATGLKLPLEGVELGGSSTAFNLTLSVSSISGTVRFLILFDEVP